MGRYTMQQATIDNSTTTRRGVTALQKQLTAAGMRIVRQSDGRYLILWRHQCVVRDLELIAAARFIDRALVRR
jgi:hypothetical protein